MKFGRKARIVAATFVATALVVLLAFAQTQLRIFDEDLGRSRRITLEEWQNRPWTEKLWEHTLGLFSSQL